jgi:Bacterial PH domain
MLPDKANQFRQGGHDMGFFSAHEIDPAEIQQTYGSILLPDEQVLTAFKTLRDTVFMTTLRFVLVDIQGITGSKKSVQSVPYRSITRFAVETAGTFDLDSDLNIWVSSMATPITVKISRKADPQAILRTLAEYVLLKK